MGNEYFYSDDSIGVIGGAEEAAFGILGAVVLVYGLIMLLTLAYSITTYVLHSLGLYTIAQRRRISKPWLAWIPVGNLWLLGSISDQYQHMAKGKITGRRKILLGLCIASVAIYFVWLFSMILGMVFAETAGAAVAGTVLLMLLGLLAFFAIVVVLAVFEYMCYYDLYCSCDPNNGVLFLILSIVFSAITPFLVFACRKKDDGMPARKPPVPAAPVEAVAEEITEEKEVEGEKEDEQEIPVADA